MNYNTKSCSYKQLEEFISELIGRKLTIVETQLLEGLSDDKKYAEIDNYSEQYLKETLKNLIKEIKEKTGIEMINKKTFVSVATEIYEKKQASSKNNNIVLSTLDNQIEHYYDQLKHFLKSNNWKAADLKTNKLILILSGREKQGYLDSKSIYKIPFEHLEKIDRLWRAYSDNNFGFSVQTKIWIEKGNRANIKVEDWTREDRINYLQFAYLVGWLKSKKADIEYDYGEFFQYDELMKRLEDNQIVGSLPTMNILFERRYYDHWHRRTVFFSLFTGEN